MRVLRAIPLCLVFLSGYPQDASRAADNPATTKSPVPDTAKARAREQLASDTSRTTADGATFIAPAGWWIETLPKVIILIPEGNSRIALVDVHQKDADSAVKRAWTEARLDLKWALKLATDAPGREGWDSFRNYDYEVSPNEQRVVGAQAAKRGDAFTVVIFDLDLAVAEKRGGQIASVFDHLQPPGFRRESFAGRKPRPLDPERIAKMKDFIEKARAALHVPGVAISLYQEGKVLFEGGFGVRELGQPTPVDAETLFMIASNTKSMTTLL
ncbi:MAG TPA: serine hydrolase domain-containing protein, partial [Candidatus Dormibacteraeota bacterium]|nr:serine hydrolase domain-containing protein [Candidatus Dormibacteraeota bacterium]